MMKTVERIFRSPLYLRELIFAGQYAALLQLIAGLFFCGLARFGGPLGSMECAIVLQQAGLTTLTVTLLTAIVLWGIRKTNPDI